jgi:1-acyl-sn-glycerol-3-phosphate acyltransferase
MNLFRALIFYVVYGLSLLIYSSLTLLASLLLPLKARYHFAVQWNRFAVWWVGVCCGVRYQIIGRDKVPAEPFVLLSNHQSPWETLFLYCEFVPLCSVLKKELLRIPFFGWALWSLKPIAIDRNKRRDARQSLLNQGKDRLNRGLNVLVFPEGTRVAPGEEKKFFTGGAELAIAAGVKLVPVAHNAGLFWPTHRLAKVPGTITVVVGEPIDTAGREARELTEQVRQWVTASCQSTRPASDEGPL